MLLRQEAATSTGGGDCRQATRGREGEDATGQRGTGGAGGHGLRADGGPVGTRSGRATARDTGRGATAPEPIPPYAARAPAIIAGGWESGVAEPAALAPWRVERSPRHSGGRGHLTGRNRKGGGDDRGGRSGSGEGGAQTGPTDPPAAAHTDTRETNRPEGPQGPAPIEGAADRSHAPCQGRTPAPARGTRRQGPHLARQHRREPAAHARIETRRREREGAPRRGHQLPPTGGEKRGEEEEGGKRGGGRGEGREEGEGEGKGGGEGGGGGTSGGGGTRLLSPPPADEGSPALQYDHS